MVLSFIALLCLIDRASAISMTASLSPGNGNITKSPSTVVVLTFDEPITQLVASDLMATTQALRGDAVSAGLSANLSNFQAISASEYVVDLELLPKEASVTLEGTVAITTFHIPGNTVKDAAGNFNAKDIYTPVTFDSEKPLVDITTVNGLFSFKPKWEFVIEFSEIVVGFNADSIQISMIPHTKDFKVEIQSVRAVTSSPSHYQLLLDIVGEGIFTVEISPGSVLDLAGNSNNGAAVTVVRDTTPPNIAMEVTCKDKDVLLDGNGKYQISDSRDFFVTVFFSEEVQQFHNSYLSLNAITQGAAGQTPPECISCDAGADTTVSPAGNSERWYVEALPPSSEARGELAVDTRVWQVAVNSLVSFNGTHLELELSINPETISDMAGNRAPRPPGPGNRKNTASVIVMANLSAFATLDDKVPTEEEEEVLVMGTTLDIFLIVLLASLIVASGILAFLMYMKRRKDRQKAKRAFEAHAAKVFREYGDPSKFGGLVFDQIVEYGTRNGYGQKRSEEGARRLMKAADTNRDGVLSSEEFLEWLTKVITKGKVINKKHVRELRTQFAITSRPRRRKKRTRARPVRSKRNFSNEPRNPSPSKEPMLSKKQQRNRGEPRNLSPTKEPILRKNQDAHASDVKVTVAL